MSPGVGLDTWLSLGSLDRELRPYAEYAQRGWRVTIATYDHPASVPDLPDGIDVVFCPPARAMWLVPFVLWNALRQADLIRTNQSGRAWYYVAAARIARRPIILRCGWIHGSVRAVKESLTPRIRMLRRLEGWAFRHADACQVATEADRQFLIDCYGVEPSRVYLRPNFVDPELFRPHGIEAAARSVVCVGRLDPIKRLDLLLRAAAIAGAAKVTLIGDGPERAALASLAAELAVDVTFIPRVPQQQLPEMLQRSQVFALSSIVEGHPKALLEAMGCGLATVGTDVPGIRDVIAQNHTGLLVEPEPDALAEALRRYFDDPALRQRIGGNARNDVVSKLSFTAVMGADLELSGRMLRSPAWRASTAA
jgi:glycosyltransferase involved in cell wall biosynthesis